MKYSITVVSNDFKLKQDIRKFYKGHSVDLFFENNRISALLQILKTKTDLFFIDMNGNDEEDDFSLIKLAHYIYPELSIITFSGNTSVERLRKLSQLGIFYCAVKPIQFIELEELMGSVQSAINKSNQIIYSPGGNMKSLNIALVLSTEKEFRENISNLLNEMGISYIFESRELDALLRIISLPLKVVFLDVESDDDKSLDFIRLIKRLKPQLNLIALSNYFADDERIIEAGADYCFLRPVLESGIKSISDKFNNVLKIKKELEIN